MATEGEEYWQQKLQEYADQDWSGKPSLFAEKAIQYFPKSGKLLELGAGVGQDGIWFATKGYEVEQSDLVTAHMLPALKDVKIHRSKVDMSIPLPYEPGSFDVIYAHLSLHYFDAQRTAELFKEIYDTLAPAGVFAFLVNSKQDPEIAEATLIEDSYYMMDGIRKRYFDMAELESLVKDYDKLLFDEHGTSYKDQAKGLNHLIEFVGRKK